MKSFAPPVIGGFFSEVFWQSFLTLFPACLFGLFLDSIFSSLQVEVKFGHLFGGLLGPSCDHFGRLVEHVGELLGNMLGKSF